MNEVLYSVFIDRFFMLEIKENQQTQGGSHCIRNAIHDIWHPIFAIRPLNPFQKPSISTTKNSCSNRKV